MKRKVCAVLLPLVLSLFSSVQAQIVIKVEGGQEAALPIAIVPIQLDATATMHDIIAADLFKSGVFSPIAPNRYPMRPTSPAQVDSQAFRRLGANYVLLGKMMGHTQAQFSLLETNKGAQVLNAQVNGRDSRAVAHEAADTILAHLTGKRGIAATQIAYVLEQQRASGRQYSLIISDYDGANQRVVFSSTQPIVSPAWSPKGDELAYMTYHDNRSQLVLQHLASGARTVLQQENGISSSPAFSPDGQKIAFAQSTTDGGLDIFVMNKRGGAKQRLTRHAAIDTEPTFSPDGRFIYFTSDRAGSPQIYRMPASGGNVERVIAGGGYSASAELSPDGKSLVLTRQSGGGYQIGTYDLATGRFEALTKGKLDEGASFAPNGQMLIYATRENGHSVLRVMNHKGELAHTLSDSSGRLRDPVWGPDTRAKR